MRNCASVTITIPKSLIKNADKKRGLIPRSRYYELAISEFLKKKTGGN